MYKDVLKPLEHVDSFAVVGLVFAVAIFGFVLYTTFFLQKTTIDHLEALPLQDGTRAQNEPSDL